MQAVNTEGFTMQSSELQQGRARRVLNDLVMAEMLLMQATVESAQAIGDGLSEMTGTLAADFPEDAHRPSFSALLQRTAEGALEPYATRLKYLRRLKEK
jgi:hypothetical protein